MNKKANKSNPVKRFLQKHKTLLQALVATFLLLAFLVYRPAFINQLFNLLQIKFIILTLIWACVGILAGSLLRLIYDNKGTIILDNNAEFLNYCDQSNGLVFFGPVGSGKTALLAMLAQELPGDNKYATFPCGLPWAEKAQIDFSLAPSQPLGVTETIFIDEINLLFKGNIVQDVREKQRYLMHFIALSRHQGTRLFVNAQRLGQVSIEQWEVVTAIAQVSLLQKSPQGIYVRCEIWAAAAWTNSKTEQQFIVFITHKYLNNHLLKSLKYLPAKQSYI